MSNIFPELTTEVTNKAERKIYDLIKSGLNDESVCFYNYYTGSNQSDFIVGIKNCGIAVVEVKGWNAHSIIKIHDKKKIEYEGSEGTVTLGNPLDQCRGYTYDIIKEIKEKFAVNLKVISLVCFPFISESQFEKSELEKIIPRENVILYDDLRNEKNIVKFIEKKIYMYFVNEIDKFNEDNFHRFCSLYLTEEVIRERFMKGLHQDINCIRIFRKRDYSILSVAEYDINSDESKALLDELFEKWIVGSKIIMVVKKQQDKDSIIQHLNRQIQEKLTYLKDYKDFCFICEKGNKKDRIFNFEINVLSDEQNIESFRIINGENLKKHIDELKFLDECSNFNVAQYELEHAGLNNIMVKAGAGTGKTFSMISRLAYLAFHDKLSAEEFEEKILMITFTNEATDNMRVRLKEYFRNMAVLTEKEEYVRFVESISNMNISTIDSLMKKVIQKFAKYLGVGQKIKITSETYEAGEHIQKFIEEIMAQEENARLLEEYKKYEIIEMVKKFMQLLAKHKVERKEYELIVHDQSSQELSKLIVETAMKVREMVIEEDRTNNRLHLNNLGDHMKMLLEILKEEGTDKLEMIDVKYVFIDEFQDTDNRTINFISDFYRLEICDFKLFIVGDVKQSIYRFRGADDQSFYKIKEQITSWEKSEVTQEYSFSIWKNYRSTVEFLEELHEILINWNGIKGNMNVIKYDSNDRLQGIKKGEVEDKSIRKINSSDEELIRNIDMCIKDKCHEWELKCEEADSDHKKTIAILVRRNHEADRIRKGLEQLDNIIETFKVDNLFFTEPCTDLLCLVRGLLYHKNPKYLIGLTESNYCMGVSKYDIYANKLDKDYILKLFNDNKIISDWNNKDDSLDEKTIIGSLRKQTALRIIRRIITQCKPWNRYAAKYDECICDKKREWYKRNLDLLIESIINNNKADYLTLTSIEEFLEIMIFTKQHSDAIREKNGDDKLRIICSTIHKSKGLEYDHVIIPHTSDSAQKRSINEMVRINDKIYYKLNLSRRKGDEVQYIKLESEDFYEKSYREKEEILREEARILYVALTRAKESVDWIKNIESENKREVKWEDLLSFGEGVR